MLLSAVFPEDGGVYVGYGIKVVLHVYEAGDVKEPLLTPTPVPMGYE